MNKKIKKSDITLKNIYWKGFEDGKKSSLKHNLMLIQGQLESQKEFIKRPKKIRKK